MHLIDIIAVITYSAYIISCQSWDDRMHSSEIPSQYVSPKSALQNWTSVSLC